MGKTFSGDKIYFDESGVGISSGFTFDSNNNWDSDFGTGIHIISNIVLVQRYAAVEILAISMHSNWEIKESYANYIDLMPLIPEKFRSSVVLQQFIDVANLNVGQWFGYIRDTQYLLDPYSVGEEYLSYLADLIGLTFVVNENTTLLEKRNQLIQAIDWYKSKGTYQALLRIGYVLGITLDAYDLYTSDYVTFVREAWFTGPEGVNPPDLATGTAWSPYDKLVLHLDNDYVDAATGKAVTDINTSFSSTVYKFGDYACYFNGTNALLVLASGISWDLEDNKFTLDIQVRFDSFSNENQIFIARWKEATGYRSFKWGYNTVSNQMLFYYSITGTDEFVIAAEWNPLPKIGTWYHIQVARDGADLSMAVEGKRLDIVAGSDLLLDTDIIYGPGQVLSIGAEYDASDNPQNFFSGYMDEIRFQNGAAMRMRDFDPPTRPYSPSTLFYKSPHIGIDINLNQVYPATVERPYGYLFQAQTYIDLHSYVEKIRPVNVVTEYYLTMYPVTDETSTVTEVAGRIRTMAFAPWSYTKVNWDQTDSNKAYFDDGTHYFDYTDDAFLQTFSKWQLTIDNKGASPDDSGYTFGTAVLEGNVDKITIYSDRAEYEILVPNDVTQTGISELGLFLSDNTTLKIACTFPDVDIEPGLTLRILVKLYYNH